MPFIRGLSGAWVYLVFDVEQMVTYFVSPPASEHQRCPLVALAADPRPRPLVPPKASQGVLEGISALLELNQNRCRIFVSIAA